MKELIKGRTCYCLLGATYQALRLDYGISITPQQRSRLLCIRAALRFEPNTMVGWNDDPARTKQEVLARIDSGIKEVTNAMSGND